MIKRVGLTLAKSNSFSAMLSCAERFPEMRKSLLRVVTYHRVDYADEYPDLYPGLLSCTPPQFAAHLDYFTSRCNVVSLHDVLGFLRGDARLPSRALLITFDDAYEGFLKNAWPLLKQRNLSATMFVPTGFPCQPAQTFWWDRLYQALRVTKRTDSCTTPHGTIRLGSRTERDSAMRLLRRWVKSLPHETAMKFVDHICDLLGVTEFTNRVLGWDDLRRLGDDGLVLAPHTRTHPILSKITDEAACDESVSSLADLEKQTGQRVPCLAYPAGGYSKTLPSALASVGFEMACSTSRGINDLRSNDPMTIRRINIGKRTSLNVLRAQFLPYNTIWS